MYGDRGDQYTSHPYILNTIRNVLLYRHLCKLYLDDHRPIADDFTKMKEVQRDEGRCNSWQVGENICPLPSDAKYQTCFLRMNPKNKKDFERVVMMGDVQHLVLLRADFGNKEVIKGNLIFKCIYRSVLGVDSDHKDPKKLTIELIKNDFQHYSD